MSEPALLELVTMLGLSLLRSFLIESKLSPPSHGQRDMQIRSQQCPVSIYLITLMLHHVTTCSIDQKY